MTQRRTASLSARSTASNSTTKFVASASRRSSAPFCAFTSRQITVAPLLANSITVALPMPEAPPVTSAVLPSSSMAPLLLVPLSLPNVGEERVHTLPRFKACQQPARAFEFIAIAVAHAARRGDTGLAPGKSAGRKRRNARRDFTRPQPQFGARHSPLDQAEF